MPMCCPLDLTNVQFQIPNSHPTEPGLRDVTSDGNWELNIGQIPGAITHRHLHRSLFTDDLTCTLAGVSA